MKKLTQLWPHFPARTEAATFDRRQVLAYAGAGLLACGGLMSALARADQSAPWRRVAGAAERLGEATPRTGVLELELPLVSENGSAVPLTVSLPGSGGPQVEAVYLFASRNPLNDELAVFHITEAVRPVRIQTRVRLDQSQTVVALARTVDGEWLAASRDVRITVSGCMVGDDAAADDADRMLARVRLPSRVARGQSIEVLTMIQHPMETGLRESSQGELLPRRIIRRFEVAMDEQALLSVELYPAISANPYLRFHLTPERSGELRLLWEEDTGEQAVETAAIEVV